MVRVRIFCGMGFTSTVFALKLNQMNDEQWDVRAFPIHTVKENGKDADAILIAPQSAHRILDVKNLYPSTPVEELDIRGYAVNGIAGIEMQVRRMLDI